LLALRDLISTRLLDIITPSITPPPAEAAEPFELEPIAPLPAKQRPTKNGQPKLDPVMLDEHHEMDDKEFDELMDAEMDADGDYEIDEEPAMPPLPAPVAPMAPMMPVPAMAPVAPMAPMAFMKPASPEAEL